MAELNNGAGKSVNPRKIRSRKLNSKVDLTAMVDLAFLLITFFMLTTSLSKPRAMNLTVPEKDGHSMNVDENRTMTILIDKNDRLKCFMGMLSQNTPKEIAFSNTKALRNEIALNKTKAAIYGKANARPQDLIVLIKPSSKSNFRNLVDVLDEMAILDVKTYAITDLAPDETKLVSMR